jgi:hypothetical protein
MTSTKKGKVRLVERIYLRLLVREGKTVWLDVNKEPLMGQLWLTDLVWRFYELAYRLHLSPINYPLHLQASIKEADRDG